MKAIQTKVLVSIFIITLCVGIFSLVSLSSDFYVFGFAHLFFSLLSCVFLILRRGQNRDKTELKVSLSSISKVFNYVLILALAVLSYRLVDRFLDFEYDSTSNKANSLAPESQKVLKSLDEDVEILGFFLGGTPPDQVNQLLNRFSRYSNHLTWRGLDPDKERPIVEGLGINEKDTLYIRKVRDEKTGVKVTRDITEETLTNGIRKLSQGRKANILSIAGHGEGNLLDDTEAGFMFLREAIEGEGYAFNPPIDLTNSEMSKRLKVDQNNFLLIISPVSAYLPGELDLIRNYFKEGGSGLILLEPNRNQDLAGVLSGLGFKIGQDMIVDKEMFTFGESRLGVQPIIDTFSAHPAVSNFAKSVILSTVRSVRKEAMADDVQELAFTSQSSWGEVNLAELLSKAPKAQKEKEDNAGPLAIASGLERNLNGLKQRVVVLGDSDFVANINLRQLFNRDFILNITNWAIGEDSPVTIRATTLEKSEVIISEKTYMLLFMFLGILLPEVMIVWSVYMWGKRRA